MSFKKVIIYLIVLGMSFMFSGCKKYAVNKSVYDSISSIESTIIDFDMIDNSIGFDCDVIKNENIAKQYADLILTITLNKDIDDYKITNIAFDPNKQIWVISYYIDDETLGGDINIAIHQKSGEIYKIWFGE